VEHIAAYSPEARGRSERMFGTLQDRLVKELALAQICNLATANRWIKEHYLPEHNRLFGHAPRVSDNAFLAVAYSDLVETLCSEHERIGTAQQGSVLVRVKGWPRGGEMRRTARATATLDPAYARRHWAAVSKSLGVHSLNCVHLTRRRKPLPPPFIRPNRSGQPMCYKPDKSKSYRHPSPAEMLRGPFGR